MKKKKILIVDDDPDDIELFFEAIEEVGRGFTCSSAGNGKDALKLLLEDKQNLPDYIFLDMNMPKMNGRECLIELKKTSFFGHIPIIIYSTSKQQSDIEELILMGAAYYLVKPNTYPDLIQALASLLL